VDGVGMSRLRDFGVSIGGFTPGHHNAITDVAGVGVGHSTIVHGDGTDAVRTGVTVIQPRPTNVRESPVFAGAVSLNGNGELTGLEWVRESGLLTTPIGLTNSFSVGVVRDALAAHDTRVSASRRYWSLPVVGETYDGLLNDIHGQHVTELHVIEALESVSSGPVAEGSVGGGTGMVCHQFKGGIGTSSRVLPDEEGGWTVGVLVQANYGRRENLRVGGVPVGAMIPASEVPTPQDTMIDVDQGMPPGSGSIIVIVATDAPLLPTQCTRLATRAAVGLSRVGGAASDGSGDIMLAFATGNESIPAEYYGDGDLAFTHELRAVPHQRLTPLFEATSDATEEAILNALLAAEDMIGVDGVVAHALDGERLAEIVRAYESAYVAR
jgi:D-aminopeptidase